MSELMMSDLYEITTSYPIDNVHYRSINLLYQPLVGNQATSLYLSLWAELDQLSLTKSMCLISRLTKMTMLSLKEIQEALSKLEGIGLLNKYYKDNTYLYELLLPLTPAKFFTHQILNTLFYKIMGKEDYQRSLICFKVAKFDKNTYKDLTSSFNDVFDLDLLRDGNPIISEDNYLHKESKIIEDNYQLELFYQGLKDYQIKQNIITVDDESIIKQLGILYKINNIDMLSMVKQSIHDDKLDHQLLTKECRDYFDLKMPEIFTNIYHKQGMQHRSNTNKGDMKEHIDYLENITPHKLLKDKQGGKEPVKRDLMVIESVMTTLGLEPGVVNVLIELALSQCDNTLPRNFMEAVGSKWKRKKVNTVVEAIDESKEYLKAKNFDKPVWSISNDETKVFEDELKVDEEELEALLAKYD